MLNEQSATSLAVTYAAFMEAFNTTCREDITEEQRALAKESRRVWAKLLHDAQQKTGITLSESVVSYF